MTKLYCDRCEQLIPGQSFSHTVMINILLEEGRTWNISTEFRKAIDGIQGSTTLCKPCRLALLKKVVEGP